MKNTIRQACVADQLAAEGLDSHAKIGSPDQPAIILSPFVARFFRFVV
jgi:hypothetical protein